MITGRGPWSYTYIHQVVVLAFSFSWMMFRFGPGLPPIAAWLPAILLFWTGASRGFMIPGALHDMAARAETFDQRIALLIKYRTEGRGAPVSLPPLARSAVLPYLSGKEHDPWVGRSIQEAYDLKFEVILEP
jgi:hypothetical protein